MRFSTLIGALVAALMTLAAVAASAQDAYRIRAGDTLRIEVIEDSSLNRNVLVSPDGRIAVPLAGSLVAAGRSIEAVQSDLASLLAPNFAAAPTVFVGVQGLAEAPELGPLDPITIDVYVLGEVGNPGRLAVEPGTTVLQLFALTGGFTNFAAKKRIQLRRVDETGTEKLYRLDYKAIEEGRSPNGLVVLGEGDVILVPQRRLFE